MLSNKDMRNFILDCGKEKSALYESLQTCEADEVFGIKEEIQWYDNIQRNCMRILIKEKKRSEQS